MGVYHVLDAYGYCQYLRECLEDAEKEWVEIGLKNGFIEADNDKKLI